MPPGDDGPALSLRQRSSMADGAEVRRTVALCLVLLTVTAAAFGMVLANQFVNFDDPVYVTANEQVQRGLSVAGVRWAFTSTEALNWHPLTWLSLQLDQQLYGKSAWGFHLTNLLLHLANSLLLFLFLQRLTGAFWRSALVAALFALHPLHVESVAWVAERKDVLSTFFGMLTFCAYLYYVRRPTLRRYLLVPLALALGLMAKPMLVTWPFLLLLLDWWPLRRLALRRPVPEPAAPLTLVLGEKLPLLIISAASCALTVVAQQTGGAIETFEHVPAAARLSNAVVSYVQYLSKTIWPVGLAPFYPHPLDSLPWWQVAASGLVLVGVTVLALVLARSRPYLLVGWLWFLGTLVPVIGLVQVGEQALADRYTYVPLIGLFLAFAWGLGDVLARWPRLRFVLVPFATGLLLSCFFGTWLQVRCWHDSRSLWARALAVTADNAVARNNLGDAILTEGKDPAAAEEHFRAAVRRRPEFLRAAINLGLALDRQGKIEDAIACYRKVLETYPGHARTRNNLAIDLAKNGNMEEAIREMFEAIRLDPDFAEGRNNLAFALARQGRLEEALTHQRECVRLEPRSPQYHRNLAYLLRQQGDTAAAEEEELVARRLSRRGP
jgi:Flp pilus assembly protein TadD